MAMKISDRTDAELVKRMAMTSDEYSEDADEPKSEVQQPNTESESTSAPKPKAKNPADMKKNPNAVVDPEEEKARQDKIKKERGTFDTSEDRSGVNQKAMKSMGAKHNIAFDHHKGSEWWDSVTNGKTQKITACMEAAKSFADDPGAFCGALAEEVGYKPE